MLQGKDFDAATLANDAFSIGRDYATKKDEKTTTLLCPYSIEPTVTWLQRCGILRQDDPAQLLLFYERGLHE